MIIVMTIGFVILMACIVAVANHLNKKIDMLDEAVYQYMKDEHNANYVPKEFHDKTCEAMAKRHQDEIADMVSVVRCKECKWKRLYDEGDTKYYYCALEDRPNRQWSVDDTDFCSWADRKE